MKTTQPSTKSSYEIYIDNDICTLKVIRNNKILFYEIKDNGESSFLGENLNYKIDQNPEWYYLDYLSSEAILKIEILTQNYDLEKISTDFQLLQAKINRGNYSFKDFSMEHSYLFSDFIDVFKQMYEFTQKSEYLNLINKYKVFFDDFFYNKKFELTNEELDIIKINLNAILNELNNLQNQ